MALIHPPEERLKIWTSWPRAGGDSSAAICSTFSGTRPATYSFVEKGKHRQNLRESRARRGNLVTCTPRLYPITLSSHPSLTPSPAPLLPRSARYLSTPAALRGRSVMGGCSPTPILLCVPADPHLEGERSVTLRRLTRQRSIHSTKRFPPRMRQIRGRKINMGMSCGLATVMFAK